MAQHSFTCDLCLEDRHEVQPRRIDDSYVCAHCVRTDIIPSFHQAIQYEFHYPPRWGSAGPIDVADFIDELGYEFVARYRLREVEYKTLPTAKRVYCKHKVLAANVEMVGGVPTCSSSHALSRGGIINAEEQGTAFVDCGAMAGTRAYPQRILTCYHCKGLVCNNQCGTQVFDAEEHICPIPDAQQRQDLEAQEGLVRGRDFQRCPGCSHPIELSDGCNHMVCDSCRSEFCFICGARATADSGHWNTGNKCPRWNQPGAHNAQHDPAPPPNMPPAGPAPPLNEDQELQAGIIAGQVLEGVLFAQGAEPEIGALIADGNGGLNGLGETGGQVFTRLHELVENMMINIQQHMLQGPQFVQELMHAEHMDYRFRHNSILFAMQRIPDEILQNRLEHLQQLYNLYSEVTPLDMFLEI